MATITAQAGTKAISTPVGYFKFDPATGELTDPATLTTEQANFLTSHAAHLGLTVAAGKPAKVEAPAAEAPAAEAPAAADELEAPAPKAEPKAGKKK